MSLVDIYEVERSGGYQLDGLKLTRQYTRKYIVVSDNANEDPNAVLFYASAPAIGDAYPSDSGALCKSRDASFAHAEGSQYHWALTVQYSSDLGESNVSGASQTPTSRSAVYHYTGTNITTPVTKDTSGNAILNSADCPFNPAPEIQASKQSISITVNKIAISSTIFNYQNTVNNAVKSLDGVSYPAKTLRLVSLDVTHKYENNTSYFEVVYNIEYNKDTWALVLLDQGFYELDASGNQTVIRDPYGQPKQEQTLLDGSGNVLGTGPSASPVFISYDVYKAVDWSAIP